MVTGIIGFGLLVGLMAAVLGSAAVVSWRQGDRGTAWAFLVTGLLVLGFFGYMAWKVAA